MAKRKAQLDLDSVSCWICLDVMKGPVTIPCGHSYCMGCIKHYWDGEEQEKKESCPQCRKAFTLRPALVKDTMLAFLVERPNRTELLTFKSSRAQKEINVSLQKTQQRIQDRKEEVKPLQEEEDAIDCSADKALEESEKIFTELIRLLEKRRSEVKQQIKTEHETEVSRVRDLRRNLEKEIAELKDTETELKEISSMNLLTEVREKLQGALRSDISLTLSKVDVKPELKSQDIQM
ncbi:E3 ubiquitin-protein ligase TRIM62-like [Pseudochaenichthys georgianus]|uniref:E3 ubiquitin-protein ligase TRIM62-like n=1 Tax=Pseudochaenichthys georgianus TaxID=52239 RepID=UPI00146CD6C8|nr:E3 ubiquitin-protein ligase TRIM62-like [Pseudochaenichthys georgianus]